MEKAVSLQWDLAQALPSFLPEEGSPWLGSGAYECHLTADGEGATPPSSSGWELCSEWVFKAKLKNNSNNINNQQSREMFATIMTPAQHFSDVKHSHNTKGKIRGS